MFKFSTLFRRKKTLAKIAREQLRENKDVIKSLRDYDEGKKDISTRNIERRMRGIRTTP